MQPLLYVETSVISYLAGRQSHSLIVAAHQELTRKWWREHGKHFDLVISEIDGGLVMASDPIVEEIRRIRDEHARRFNYDLRAIVADLREQEQKHPERLIPLPPKSPRRKRKAL